MTNHILNQINSLRCSFLLVPLLFALSSVALAQPPPLNFDWRDYEGHNLVSIVKNQGACGSDWIFSAVAMVESRCMIKLYQSGHGVHEVDFSEQYILACGSGYFGEFDCAGGYLGDVLIHLRDVGAPYEECYLNQGSDSFCPSTTCPGSGEPLELLTPVQTIDTHFPFWDSEDLKNEIMRYGPVAVRMDLYSDFYSDYESGIYEHTTGTYVGGKTQLIVGWGYIPRTETSYWICKNTWGENWGEDGYFRIVDNASHAGCNFGERAWTATVTPDVSAVPDLLPNARFLAQNVPNPFNPSTEITYTPPANGRAVLAVFDAAGRRLRVLADADHEADREYRVAWDGRDAAGRPLSSGVYFYRFEGAGASETRRMVMLR